MEQLYKVGDNVLIKKDYDPGCNCCSYLFNFLKDMLIEYGGKICTIKEVGEDNYPQDSYKIPDDGHRYYLKEDPKRWSWASSMFEPEF